MTKSKRLFVCLFIVSLTVGCGGTDTPPTATEAVTPTATVADVYAPTPEPVPTTAPVTDERADMIIAARKVEFGVEFEDVFRDGLDNAADAAPRFKPRGGETLTYADEGGRTVLLTTNRTATWEGPIIDMSGYMKPGKRYDISVMVKSETPLKINCMAERGGNKYDAVGSAVVKGGEWAELTGSYLVPDDGKHIKIYFESDWKETPKQSDLADFITDGFTVREAVVRGTALDLPPMWRFFDFKLGAGITTNDLITEKRREMTALHFNSVTMGNEMKPDNLLDYEKTVESGEVSLKTYNMELGLKFAQANGLGMRGHTLVWHEQTPRWFFAVGYSKDAGAELVGREEMLSRMERYIKIVLEYCNERYPGVVYAFDVVNEAIDTGGDALNVRVKDNMWYETVGADYPERAFAFARRYGGDIKLFYNDYNEYEPQKTAAIMALVKRVAVDGNIDGIGLQSHIGMNNPSVADYETAIRTLGETGLELHITELDISNTDDSPSGNAKLAARYGDVMSLYRRVARDGGANITSVTLWGLTDDNSWLNNAVSIKYPLLFDKYLQPKQAYWSVIENY